MPGTAPAVPAGDGVTHRDLAKLQVVLERLESAAQRTATMGERTAELLQKLHDDVHRTDPQAPGLAMRQYTTEKQIAAALTFLKWAVTVGTGGGLTGLGGTIYFLQQLSSHMADTGAP